MLDLMAAPKTRSSTKRALAKPVAPKPTRKDGRVKSKLTLAAEAGALRAKRELLLSTLNACDWNLSETARQLAMPGASQVIRAITDAQLTAEYEAAKAKRA